MMSDVTMDSNSMVWNDISLFGGAIFIQLPLGYMDLSHIRQVPDHQECYMELNLNHSNKNDSKDNNSNDEHLPPESVFIIEILEQSQEIDHDRIIEYLFYDLAETNGIVCTGGSKDHNEDEPHVLFFQSDDDKNDMLSPPNQLLHVDDETDNIPIYVNDNVVIYRSGRGIQRIRRGKDNNHHHNDDGNMMETISIQMFVLRLLQQQYKTDLLITVTTPIHTLVKDNNNNNSITTNTMVQQEIEKQKILFQHMISSIQIHDLTLFNP